MSIQTNYTGLEVAVIGIAGRFPGAENSEQFWQNLKDGKESISFFSDEELIESGVDQNNLLNPNYVKAKGVFPGLEHFDADFFNYTPKDASLLDPQVRALHEEVYHALEDAGYASGDTKDIGLFIGSTGNISWEMETIQSSMSDSGANLNAVQFNDKDFAATRIAYSLNLQGPCVTVHSACSTSLYSVDVACRHLLTGGCSLAIAGGSGLSLPGKNGYMYEKGMIKSSDGHCRPFDQDADGTVEGNGAGIVVLKRLDEAIEDKDRIYAVVRGSASNNDGNRKAGYTAPSIDGQSDVIKRALAMADVESNSISYVETHGTGTNLGDPIEIEGLKKAFSSSHPSSCGIGSLKSNIGHLDAAAGISSFIKTVLALKNETLPASINYENPNTKMDLENSPFYIVTETKDWQRQKKDAESGVYHPLRAGVSSFGIGGTNVHMVLEEPPEREESGKGRDLELLCLSAHNVEALERTKENYLHYLKMNSEELNPNDLAWSTQMKEGNLQQRFSLAYKNIEDLVQGLTNNLTKESDKKQRSRSFSHPNAYFLFSGQGSQYPGMTRDLYKSEPAFRKELEICLQLVEDEGDTQLRQLLLEPIEGDDDKLQDTDFAQVALFVVEYSMSRLLMEWGIYPSGLVGHSLGEFTAACISGVLSLREAIQLIMNRSRLMKAMPPGSMLSVNASEKTITPLLFDGVFLAAVNSPRHCTVSGSDKNIRIFEDILEKNQLNFHKLHANQAFHSPFMGGAKEAFEQICSNVTFGKPSIPYISNLTGQWMTDEDAADPSYYGNHLQSCVRFGEGIEKILSDEKALFIEVGPGHTLSTFVRQADRNYQQPLGIINTIRHPQQETVTDDAFLVEQLGKIWSHGVWIDWKVFYRGQVRNHMPLPLYPFEKQKFPVGNAINKLGAINQETRQKVAATQEVVDTAKSDESSEIIASQILWESTLFPPLNDEQQRTCLVMTDDMEDMNTLMNQLPRWRSIFVQNSDQYQYEGTLGATIRNGNTLDLCLLIQDFREQALLPCTVIIAQSTVEQTEKALRALVHTLQIEWKDNIPDVVILSPVSPISNAQGLDTLVRGLVTENPDLSLRLIDGGLSFKERDADVKWANRLKREMDAHTNRYPIVSYSNGLRFVPKLREIETEKSAMTSQFQDEHWILVSHENRLEHSLDFLQNFERDTDASVSVLPYRFESRSFDNKTVLNLLEEIRLDQDHYLSTYGLKDLQVELTEAHRKMDEYAARLSYDYINDVFFLEEDRIFSKEELKNKLDVVPSLVRYVDYFLHMLIEDHLLEKVNDDVYRVTKNVQSLREPKVIRNEIESMTSLFTGQLDLLEHSVSNFGPSLRGEISTLSVLYPTEQGNHDLMLKSHRGTIQEKEEDFAKDIFASMIKKITRGKKKLRILEAGGGYGTMLRKVAPLLKEIDIDVEFYFTDVGSFYLDLLRKYALEEDLDFIHFGLFDITKSPSEQGLEPFSFDLVFGYNVVHATENISVSLRNLQKLLKPGALLCVIERTRIRRYVDLVWGLLEGWWHFDEKERELSPLVPIKEWERKFNEIGLDGITSFPENGKLQQYVDVGVIVGQMPVDNHSPKPKNMLSSKGDVNVLTTVNLTDVDSLKPSFDQIIRKMPNTAGIILWDEPENRKDTAESITPNISEEIRIANDVNSYVIEKAADLKIPEIIISVIPGDHLWDSRSTERVVALAKTDISSSPRRVYLPEGDNFQIDGIMQLIEGMLRSGIKQLVINQKTHRFFSVKPTKHETSTEQQTVGLQNMEKLIRQIWSELFGWSEIDIDADFFELGGDSFKLIQMTGNLKREGYKVFMNEVYNYPTIRSLARYINDDNQLSDYNLTTPKDMEDRLYERTGVFCAFHVVQGSEPVNVLFVEGDNSTSNIDTIREQFKNIEVSNELLPHYIFKYPKSAKLNNVIEQKHLTELGYLTNSEKTHLENLRERIVSERDAFEKEILKQPTLTHFNLSDNQKIHFSRKTRLQFYLIEFREVINTTVLEQALCDVIGSHSLLRSSLEKHFSKFRWKKHVPPQKTPIPELDISNLTLEAQGRVMDWLAKEEWKADFKKTGSLMYHVILIKLNEQNYYLFFQFDHSIFDLASGQTIRRQIFQRYNELKKGVRTAMKVSTSYEEYLNQINKGPIGISHQGLKSKFDLEQYGKYINHVESKVKEHNTDRFQTLRFSIDLSSFNFNVDENRSFEIAVQVYILVLSRLLNTDAVPFELLVQSRRYEEKNFSDVVGFLVDTVPLLIPVDRDNPSRMTDLIRERIELINKHNINFANLRSNSSLFRRKKQFKEAEEQNETLYSPCLLNFAGTSEAEYGKVWDYRLSQLDSEAHSQLNYGYFYGIAQASDTKLDFLVFCKFVNNMELIRKLLDEEIDHLVHVQAGKETEEQ